LVAFLAAPAEGAVSLDCRVRVIEASFSAAAGQPELKRADGHAKPAGERPIGSGTVIAVLQDGRRFLLQVDTLFCRRDGGLVPPHGGANIADMTGRATPLGLGLLTTGPDLEFQMHVEDRGSMASVGQDYLALRVTPVDEPETELVLTANFLAGGEVELTPDRDRHLPADVGTASSDDRRAPLQP
jgi:hypothetical protein